MSKHRIKYYSPAEEKLNILSHALGLLLSLVALPLLVTHHNLPGHHLNLFAVIVFGLSLIILYTASTLYHYTKKNALRVKLKIIDHASIYILIAGTYTPFTLITLSGTIGWTIFGVCWAVAVCGIILKIFFTGRFRLASTIAYLLMGWAIIFAIKPLVNNLSYGGVLWLVIGGVSYTIGAALYMVKKLKFNHAIFHVFILLGSISHFVAVYFYVLNES